MTLIAAWLEDGVPILAGDVLITHSSATSAYHHPIPTRDDLISFLPHSSGISVAEMYQKIYVISPTLCIGFSGSTLSAADIISFIFSQFGKQHCNLEQLSTLLKSITDHIFPSCQIIGWIANNENFNCFSWDSANPGNFATAPSFAIGSGAQAFNSLLDSPMLIASKNPLEKAVGLITLLLKDEVLYGSSLVQRFGAAYKIISYYEGEFRVIPSLLYFPMQIEETNDPGALNGIQPNRILKTYQNDEMMEVMVMMLTEESVGTHEKDAKELITHRMHYIPPVFVQPGDQYVVNSNLELISDFYGIGIDIKLRETTGIPGKEIFIISVCQSFSESVRGKYISIDDFGDGTEGITVLDPVFKKVFKVLSGINRDALMAWARNGHVL